MSNNEKENLAKMQTAKGPTETKPTGSSTSTVVNDKTEDDVGDEMDMSMTCDECKKLAGGLKDVEIWECGHHFCQICAPAQKKEPHQNCSSTNRRSDAFLRDLEDSQNADHDGDLSQDGPEKEKRNSAKLTNQSKRSLKKKKKLPENHIYSFLYQRKPVVVSIMTDAPFSELLSRLYLLASINRNTHEIRLKAQKSSSEDADGEYSTHGETIPLNIIDHTIPIRKLYLPRQKMMILEVRRKRSQREIPQLNKKRKEKEAEEEQKIAPPKIKLPDPSPLQSPNNSQGPMSN